MTASVAASFELQGLPDRDAFIDSALAFLSRLFPGDGVAWNSVDMEVGKVELRGTPPEVYNDPSWARRMEQFSGDHPMVRSYLSVVPTVRALPRRLSDVATRVALHRTQAYNEVLKPLGIEHQLTILTGRPTQQAGRCWGFVRTGRDYTDDEIALATEIQPMLRALDQCYNDDRIVLTEATAQYGLSQRELEVLQKLANGHTAVAIGRLLRISPSTVRKHLQHVYDKIGARDRLQAVSLARRNGLISTEQTYRA